MDSLDNRAEPNPIAAHTKTMENIDIELKKLELNLGFSEETYCFKAILYINGKKVANVQNNGQGEMTRFDWDTPQLRDEYGSDEGPIETAMMQHISSVVQKRDEQNQARKVKRMLEKGLYFTRVGFADRWYGYLKLKTKEDWDKAREKLSKLEGVDKVLNDIPLAEAVPYFYKNESEESNA